MNKKSQTKKRTSGGISVNETPLTNNEKMELHAVSSIRGGWAKKNAIDAFCIQNNRIAEEIKNYLKKKPVLDHSIDAPKDEPQQKQNELPAFRTGSEIRITNFKSLRVEDGTVIIGL